MVPFVEFDAFFAITRHAVINESTIWKQPFAVAGIDDLRSVRERRVLHSLIFPPNVVRTANLQRCLSLDGTA